jgi:ureidoglycolate lyase
MRQIHARPLSREGFAPFGDVLEAPADGGRTYFDGGLGNARPDASPSLSLTRAAPAAELPLVAKVMERHEFSSQSFIPLAIGRWLIIVAPSAAGGGPDASAAQAFLAGPGQGITFHVGTWHHPLTVLDRPAELAVFMWRDGTAGDEEFVPVDPFLVSVEVA